jgi:upstream activation factor subunit UAF30
VINADPKLKEIFGKSKADMFEMTKLVNGHLK